MMFGSIVTGHVILPHALSTQLAMMYKAMVIVDGTSSFGFDRSFVSDLQLKMGEQTGSGSMSTKRKANNRCCEERVCCL